MLVHNLPSQPTAFVGRTDELAEIKHLLSDPDCRLLTLVGQGGIGKTRLALRAATDQISAYAQGVHMVLLQPIPSADLIPSAIASALKIRSYGAEDPHLQIIKYLSEKHLLLVMDNFEHLLDGIGFLTEILAAAPGVKILMTSRERLNMQEEWTLALDGLSFPDAQTTDSLEKYSAVQLFVQRARQLQSTFSLKSNAEAVKAICQQMEGMPLGIELAAAWLRVMTCQQIAAQMTSNLEFLTTPLRNIPERHRSLRAVFEQSWNLLSDSEQAVLMRLSVFRGGFNLEAAEAVAGASLIILASLTDKSLIRLNPAGRYDLHELLRQYAADKLAEAGKTIDTANQHLLYFMKLAEAGEVYAYGREQVIWYDRQEAEMDNLRAALAWSVSNEEIELGLRMASALRWVWEMRGHLVEGAGWFEKLLATSDEVIPSVRAKALHRACETLGQSRFGYPPQASEWGQQALTLARSLNDKWNIAWSLSASAFFTEIYPQFDEAAAMAEESLMLFRELGDLFGLSHALRRRGVLAITQKDYPYAQRLLEEALTRDRQSGDKNAVAWELVFLGDTLAKQHDRHSAVITVFQEGLSLLREIKDMGGIACALRLLADFERSEGNHEMAMRWYKEGITVLRSNGLQQLNCLILAGMGGLIAAEGEFERGARLLGAAYPQLQNIAVQQSNGYQSDIAFVRAQLDHKVFDKVWTEGIAMSIEQAMAYALGEEPLPTETAFHSPNQRSAQLLIEPLSDREFEVLWLMAQGLSNPQIAERLVVATGTIKAHTNNIFGKLNVINRVQAVNRAKELHLL